MIYIFDILWAKESFQDEIDISYNYQASKAFIHVRRNQPQVENEREKNNDIP